MSELKNCPFCGSSDVGGAGGQIHCYSCPAKLEVQNTNTHYAAQLWNKRADNDEITRLQSEVERLRGRCGELEKIAYHHCEPFVLRKQAEAVEEAYKSTVLYTKGDHPQYEKGFDDAMNQYDWQMDKYVDLLRQQSDEAEKAGG